MTQIRLLGLRAGGKAFATALAALAVLVALLLAYPVTAQAAAAPAALDYLSATQRANGGFSDSTSTGDAGITPWAIMAISASGQNPGEWKIGDTDPVTFLRTMDITSAALSGAGSGNTPAFYAKLILSFKAAGRPDLILSAGQPSVNLVSALLEYRVAEDGHFSLSKTNMGVADVSTTAWAMLALAAAGGNEQVLDEAATWLKSAQTASGGYPFQTGDVNDVDDTAAAIQALVAAGVSPQDQAVQGALAFLRANQNDDGGFVSFANDPRSTAESTAWAIQAIRASGEDPASWTSNSGMSPLAYLTGLQTSRGSFEHRKGQTANPLMSTTQALIALGGRAFPFGLDAAEAKPAYAPVITSVSPADNAVVDTGTIQVKCEYVDNEGGAGIDTSKVRVLVNGEDKTSAATVTATSLTLNLSAQNAGTHTLSFTIADLAGHTVSKEVKLNVVAPAATTTSTSTTLGSTTSTTRRVIYTTTTTRRFISATGGGSSITPGLAGRTTTTRRVISTTGGGNSRTPGIADRTTTVTGSATGSSPPSTIPGMTAPPKRGASSLPDTPDVVVEGFADDTEGGPLPFEGGAEAVQITGQTVALDETGGGRGIAGLVGGGVLALLPLGIGLSMLVQRRQTALLAQSIDGGPAATATENGEVGIAGRTAAAMVAVRSGLSSTWTRIRGLGNSAAEARRRLAARLPGRGSGTDHDGPGQA
jgi:hypothetical protein